MQNQHIIKKPVYFNSGMNKRQDRHMHKHTDLAYLREIANGSNVFIEQMLNLFIEQVPHSLMRIDTALHNKDWQTVRATVHKIKPSTSFTGLHEIKDIIPQLEKDAAEHSNLEDIPAMVAKIKKVCNEAIPELKEELEKLK